MIRKSLFLAAASLTMAFAGSNYEVMLYKPTTVNGTLFKPGECRLKVEGDKVVITQGKVTAESPVTIEKSRKKFDANAIAYTSASDGEIQEIQLRGTSDILHFGAADKPEPAVATK